MRKINFNNILKISLGLILFLYTLSSCSSSKSVVDSNDYVSIIDNKQNRTKSEKELIKEAKKWLGTKYVYGGHSKKGTDCSGFVMEVYLKVYDIKLPRTSKDQQAFCKRIKKSNLKIGDLVFFTTTKNKKRVSHVGIYIGDDEFIHASSSKGVVISKLSQSYYVRNYYSSGRVPGVNK